MRDDLPSEDPHSSPPNNPWPFVIAVGIFVAAATAAVVFLREDTDLRVVRSDQMTRVGDDVVEVEVADLPACDVVERAQTDTDQDAVYVELVVRDGGDCPATRTVVAVVALVEPLDGRRLVGGAGRTELPCTSDGSDRVVCTAG